MKNMIHTLSVLLLLLLGFAPFAQALSVSSVTPGTTTSPGTLNVPVNASVVVDFDHDVRWGTILKDGNYRITLSESATGNPVAVTYSPQSNDDVFTLTPTSNLKYSTIYRVDISWRVREVGNPGPFLSSDYRYFFKTVTTTDTTRPTVTPIYPASGATNIPVDSSISALFSEDMDISTVVSPATSITISPAVSGTISYDEKEATFQPSSLLSPNTVYTVTILNTVKDTAGNAMLQNYIWSFKTVNPDSIPPQVVSTIPVEGTTGVSTTTTLKIVFNEAMLASTITSANFTVSGGTWSTPAFDGDRTVTLTLSSGSLAYSTNYTVTVSTGVKDLAGNSMASAYYMHFTTIQNITPPSSDAYAQIPPFVAGVGVKPNLLLIVDNSGSMEEFAYKTAGKGNSTGTNADPSYNSSTIYYGYFDSNKMFKYNTSGYFEIDTTKTLDRTNFFSGNMLNWLTMRRADVVRKVLVGGRVVQGSNSNPVNPRSTASTNNYLIGLADTSRDRYKVYSGVYYKVDDGPNLYKCSSSSCSSYTNTYKIKVLIGTQPPTDGLVTQYADRIRMGTMFFNPDGTYYEDGNYGDKDGGYIASNLGSTKEAITYQIETSNPVSWTPLAESLYESVRYFQARPSAYNSGIDYTGSDPITQSCQQNFVMILTDGESTKDRNLPGGYWSGEITKVTDPYGFNVQTWMDSIATNEGISSKKATAANGSEGTYYLEGVSYYAHNTDLRSATIGKSNIDEKQNLTIYTVFAFDDSAVGRELLKRTAKYGGYDDADKDGKPFTDNTCGTTTPNAKCVEWDKNGDGIPDTYFEAQQGQQLVTALGQAFNSIISKVSSGTAASILGSSEGSGASLLQAVFYPNKIFEQQTEVNWIGEMQNLWYYVDPFASNSTVREDTDFATTTPSHILNLTEDYVVDFKFDGTKTVAGLARDTNGDGLADTTGTTVTPDDVKSIWRAGKQLWAKTPSSRRIHTSVTGTSLLAEEVTGKGAFYWQSGSTANATTLIPYLQAANVTESGKLIDYIRGTDQTNYRNRKVALLATGSSSEWKLGDIVSSTPRIQSTNQLNSYSVGYGDKSYAAFTGASNYKKRGMVYVGANDGMLHAFKLGNLTVSGASISGDVKATLTGTNLGEEQWAYIPRNTLPYLKYFADKDNYKHLFYVDGPTIVSDVGIGKPSACGVSTDYSLCVKDETGGTNWKTVLIGSMGLGGASKLKDDTNCADGASGTCVKTPIFDPLDTATTKTKGIGYSSYFALDITDQYFNTDGTLANQPTLKWEFAPPGLGYATSGAAIIRVAAKTQSIVDGNTVTTVEKNKNGKWFAVMASGPTGPVDPVAHKFLGKSDQNLKIFVVDLGATAPLVENTSYWVIDTGINRAFGGSITPGMIDTDKWNKTSEGNYSDDALYVGYSKANILDSAAITPATTWTNGGVLRILTKEDTNPANWTVSTLISGIGSVNNGIMKLQDRKSHKLWLYFGTGRYFYNGDDDESVRYLMGVQEGCYRDNDTIDPSCDTSATGDGKPLVCSVGTNGILSGGDCTLVDQSSSVTAINTNKGWYLRLPGEDDTNDMSAHRSITDAVAVPSGMVLYTSFAPTTNVCKYGGESRQWSLRYDTGGLPLCASLKGKVLIQMSTGSFEQQNLADIFACDTGTPDAPGPTRPPRITQPTPPTPPGVGGGAYPAPPSAPIPGKPPVEAPTFIYPGGNAPLKKVIHIQEK